jgi:hypothetical protein
MARLDLAKAKKDTSCRSPLLQGDIGPEDVDHGEGADNGRFFGGAGPGRDAAAKTVIRLMDDRGEAS